MKPFATLYCVVVTTMVGANFVGPGPGENVVAQFALAMREAMPRASAVD